MLLVCWALTGWGSPRHSCPQLVEPAVVRICLPSALCFHHSVDINWIQFSCNHSECVISARSQNKSWPGLLIGTTRQSPAWQNSFVISFLFIRRSSGRWTVFIQSVTDKFNSLWMQFVESPVHPYGDVQMVQSSVLSDLIDHGRHSCPTYLSCTMWHCSTHLHDNGNHYHRCKT